MINEMITQRLECLHKPLDVKSEIEFDNWNLWMMHKLKYIFLTWKRPIPKTKTSERGLVSICFIIKDMVLVRSK